MSRVICGWLATPFISFIVQFAKFHEYHPAAQIAGSPRDSAIKLRDPDDHGAFCGVLSIRAGEPHGAARDPLRVRARGSSLKCRAQSDRDGACLSMSIGSCTPEPTP